MTPITCHTLVLGTGAAGLAAALRLRAEGVPEIRVVTEGLTMGTSINTGSDKQTYYKLGMYGREPDSPELLAETYFANGSMHGDLALVESALSARAFFQLANLGVPFPFDGYGQYIGYKTDHDPLRRATSCGPYTSREMCRALIAELQKTDIPVDERQVAVKLLTVEENGSRRAAGAVTADWETGELRVYRAENVIFAVGGPGGLYEASVYPPVHTGAIGLALEAGAAARNLPESQFGLASIKFRWNVSGTYMQVLPRFISTAADGHSDEREFLIPYFSDPGTLNSMVFLKGYQWPFDVRKAIAGSSLIDLLVYYETVVRGRRVFLDFRSNPTGLDFNTLSPEAHEYLEKSGALFGTPLERLRHMNPGAIKLYEDHRIHLVSEPLEIAVCSQHNNGGLAGDCNYESENIAHLFPIGEVNGSHGVTRPGGSALNAGQVAAFRAAERIAAAYREPSLAESAFVRAAEAAVAELEAFRRRGQGTDWRAERREFQHRMTEFASHLRDPRALPGAVAAAWEQYRRLTAAGAGGAQGEDAVEQLRNLQLCLAHAVYLEAVKFQADSGVGSRGSAMVLAPEAPRVHAALPEQWRLAPEDPKFREQVLLTVLEEPGKVSECWQPRRPVPHTDDWFETVWATYRREHHKEQ